MVCSCFTQASRKAIIPRTTGHYYKITRILYWFLLTKEGEVEVV